MDGFSRGEAAMVVGMQLAIVPELTGEVTRLSGGHPDIISGIRRAVINNALENPMGKVTPSLIRQLVEAPVDPGADVSEWQETYRARLAEERAARDQARFRDDSV